jgi:hypothetical protein
MYKKIGCLSNIAAHPTVGITGLSENLMTAQFKSLLAGYNNRFDRLMRSLSGAPPPG